MNITGLTIFATGGWLMSSLGATYDTWQFWCVMALMWAAEHSGVIMGRQQIVNLLVDAAIEQQQEKDS